MNDSENDWVYLGGTKVNVRSAGGPTSITFLMENGELALKINSDGTIETGSGIKPTDAAARVIEAVKQMWSASFDAAIAAERKACARLAKELLVTKGHYTLAVDVVDAIRARGKEGK